MIGDRGRQKSAEKIAGDVSGDIGGQCAGGVRSAAMLRQIGHREGKGRCHEHALGDAQASEREQIRRHCQKRSRNCEQGQADPDAFLSVDLLAKPRDG